MTTIPVKLFYPTAKPLKNLIKYFWVLESDRPIILNHTILPMHNIDILINLLSPMTFEKNGVVFEPPGNIYFSGITGDHALMRQKGVGLTIGISFFPAGLYPFFSIPVGEFRGETIGLESLVNRAALELEEKLREAVSMTGEIRLLEIYFLNLLKQKTMLPSDTCQILNLFHSANLEVRDFCREYGVHSRKLERLFQKYVGASPKQFLRLNRFMSILNRLTSGPDVNLTTLAYDFGYYDQGHFIKDFNIFTGSSPSKFIREKRSFKQIMETT